MDFLDPRKRRAHTIRLFIGYALVGLALLIGTGILALYTYGFDFNRKTKTIVQNGLVFVDAHPESADIYLNGKSNGKTNNRLVIPEGTYNIELRRSGYRTWKNTFNLQGGQVQQLVYPFLFPEKLTSRDIQAYAATPGLSTESPDRHWLLVQQPGSLTDFELFDLTTTTNIPSSVSFPATAFTSTGKTHTLELSEWSTDNRHLVVKHTFEGGSEYVLLDKDSPTASQNLTKLFAKPNTQITLRDKKFDQYYLYDQVSLSLVSTDIKGQTFTPVLSNVVAFKPHSADTIIYVTNEGAADGKELVRVRSGGENYTLREIAKSDIQDIDLARFGNHWYMVAGSAAEGRVYIFKDPVETINKHDSNHPMVPLAAMKHDNPRFVSFSDNARFIEVQTGSKFSVYDLEEVNLLHYDTHLNLPLEYKATWMDGHRLTAVADGKVRVFDFDDTNMQTLNDADANFRPSFDRDYKALFTMSPSVAVAGKTALVRTELKAATR